MRKIFTLFCFAAVGLTSNAQRLFVEDFNYPTGELTESGVNVSGGNWFFFSGTSTYLFVNGGDLMYPNYYTGPSAGSNHVSTRSNPTSSEDAYRTFTPQASGSVYSSFLIKINQIQNLAPHIPTSQTDGEYFVAFLPSDNISLFRARVFIRKGLTPNTVNFGINTTSTSAVAPLNPVTWAPLDYDSGVVHLITFSYQYVAGASNDQSKLWVNQPFSSIEPVPSALAIMPALGVETADLGRLVIRQAAFNTPNADIDAIVVATNYSDASLPLNLTSFNAVSSGKATLVKWTTDNEVNVSGFSIEKSLDGTNFSQVEFVNAKNNSSHNVYTLNDTKVKAGISYYRLKLVDKNGAFKYSGIVAVKNNAITKAEVFPNPAKGNLTVSHSEAETGAVVRIMSLDGKQVKSVKVLTGSTQTALTINELVKGNYIVVFENSGSKSVTQFTKQ
jgi:hypothetical protein